MPFYYLFLNVFCEQEAIISGNLLPFPVYLWLNLTYSIVDLSNGCDYYPTEAVGLFKMTVEIKADEW